VGELCRNGTMEELTRTDKTQLTILTCSVATWRLLEERGCRFAVATGHSLGEYSALVATGQMAFADALRVVDVRGRAMHACGEEREGAMAAIMGLDAEVVDEICASVGDVWAANYNSPGQVVVSGSPDAVRLAGQAADQRGAKRVSPLRVSGAFHTPFMAGAADSLAQALAQVEFRPAPTDGGTFFSTTEVRYPDTDELAEVLARQLVSPVRFAQSIMAIREQPSMLDHALEIGPGNVLCGLVKRIDRHVTLAATSDAHGLEQALAAVSAAG
jgi:[acyl-carrier-protein] S-malonyltransferase